MDPKGVHEAGLDHATAKAKGASAHASDAAREVTVKGAEAGATALNGPAVPSSD